MPQAILITIYHDGSQEQCAGRCGMDCSRPEDQRLIAQRLAVAFGERVKVEFVDLGANPERGREVLDQVRRGELMLPLVAVNGKLRLSGYFEVRQLQDAIQVEMEMSGD